VANQGWRKVAANYGRGEARSAWGHSAAVRAQEDAGRRLLLRSKKQGGGRGK